MNEALKQLQQLKSQIDTSLLQIGEPDILKKIAKLQEETEQPSVWDNPDKAQALNQQLAKLNSQLAPWQKLKKQVEEYLELTALADESMQEEIWQKVEVLTNTTNELKNELMYSGQYDNHDVILSIYAGAGGTDAQDWAQMLLRMYIRWAETSKGISVKIIEQSFGEEAGIKSTTLAISGKLAYGKLKSENGVHRLVRLSPFNADHLRQTSFAKVEVMPKIDEPSEVMIDEKDLKIDVYRAGGHGGQSVNTTDSAVRITHIPTNITVAIQNERSQLQNKELALTILRSKIAQLKMEQHQEKIEELKGPNEQAAWGNQIRSYVLHPYTMVKDLRTKYETNNAQAVLDGQIEGFIKAYLEQTVASD